MIKDAGEREAQFLSIGTSRIWRPPMSSAPSTGQSNSAQTGRILCTGPFVRPGMHEKSQGVMRHFFGQQVVVIQHQEQRLWLPFFLQVFPRSLWQPLAVAARHPGETALGAL